MTLDKLIQQVDAEEAQADREAIKAIKAYDVERANEQQAKAQKDAHGNTLRDYFKTHQNETELVDPEWGLRAFMQPGGKTNVYEHPNVIRETNPKLYARLEQLGVFMFNDDAVKQALKDGLLIHGDLDGFAHEGSRSPSLQVKPVKR